MMNSVKGKREGEIQEKWKAEPCWVETDGELIEYGEELSEEITIILLLL